MQEFTNKQRRFICYYVGVSEGNATDAARRAGYAQAYMAGPRLMANDRIRDAVEAKVTEVSLTADEVLSRLTEQATASMGELVKINSKNSVSFDFAKAKRKGKLHLIKKMKRVKGGWDVELYDAQAALALLGKFHNLFNDRQQQTEQSNPFPDLIDVRDVTRNGTANGHKS